MRAGSKAYLITAPKTPIRAVEDRVLPEKMSIGQYGYIVLAIDTEGNMIGLHSMA